ncbi:hypothetical protein EY679_03125 [Enterococcus faecium]|nr:hypothetical protein [Enterococcus faecium]
MYKSEWLWDWSEKYSVTDKVWELWGEDTVSDNDTSGKAARSEKMVRYSNEAVTRQPPAGF